jgi:hypothetical protein
VAISLRVLGVEYTDQMEAWFVHVIRTYRVPAGGAAPGPTATNGCPR